MASPDTTREYTLSLPPETAARAEEIAARERRSVTEVVEDALLSYCAQQTQAWLDEVGEYAASRNPGYTPEDVPRLIAEIRQETSAEQNHT